MMTGISSLPSNSVCVDDEWDEKNITFVYRTSRLLWMAGGWGLWNL